MAGTIDENFILTMIAHTVAEAIHTFHPGDVLNYYVNAPGIPKIIRSILITNITNTELHFVYTKHGKSIHSMVDIKDDLTDYKNVFYN